MFIKGEIEKNISGKIDELNKVISEEKTKYFFSKCGSFFRKGALDDDSFITDIDFSVYLLITKNNREKVCEVIKKSIQYICENYYLNKIKCGVDKKFDFTVEVNEDRTIKTYEPDIIRERIQEMYETKYISKKEFEEINSFVKDDPSFEEVYDLILLLKKYKNIFWNCDEIKKGEKIHRKNKIKYIDFIQDSETNCNCVSEVQNGKYVLFDIVFVTYKLMMDCNIEGINNENAYYKCRILNESNKTMINYTDIFKFEHQKRYFKVFKRLKSFFKSLERQKVSNKIRGLLKKETVKKYICYIMKDIENISRRKEFRCLDQISARIETIIILVDHKPESEIKRLVVELLNDSIEFCNHNILNSIEKENKNVLKMYNTMKNKYNKDKIKSSLSRYKEDVDNKINILILPHLKEIYRKTDYLLPFILKI